MAFQGLDCALNVTGWDVSGVTDMSYTLYQVGPLFSITGLETWSTTNLRNLNHFAEQSQAKESAIKGLENWDVSDVTSMIKAFAGIHQTNNFNDDLSKWDVRNVTTMNQMFRQAPLFWAEIGMWNTTSLRANGMKWQFAGTTRIFENADAIHHTPPTNLARWDFCRDPAPSNFPVHAQRYNGSDWCANNTDPVDDRDAHTHPADDISFYWTKSACEDNSSLVDEACISVALEPKADYGHVWVWNRTQFKCKFTKFANLKSAIHAKCRNGTIDSTALTTVPEIADLCRTAVNISTWDVSEVTSLSWMFADVGNPSCDLTGIGEWDVSSVTNMHHAFSSHANPQDGKARGSWRNLNLSRWNMSQVTTIKRIFYHSTYVDIGDISDWDLCDINQTTDSPGDFWDYFSRKPGERTQDDFRRLPTKTLCDANTNESAPYPSGDRTYYFNKAACGVNCDSQYVDHDLGTMWYADTFTTPTLICGSNRSLYDSQQGCTRENRDSCAEVRNKYMLNNDSQCDSVDGEHGTYWLSETACGLLCGRRSDYLEDTYWYPQNQTRTELICGKNKTVYDSPVGCAVKNDADICTQSPSGRSLDDTQVTCTHVQMIESTILESECFTLANATHSDLLDHTVWWSNQAHANNWENDIRIPSGCSIARNERRVRYNHYGWRTMNAQTAESNGYLRLTQRLDGTYYLSKRVCETEETSCDSRVDYTYGEMWYPQNQTRTEHICGDNKTVYDSAVGCAEGNGHANCTESPSGRWLRDMQVTCTHVQMIENNILESECFTLANATHSDLLDHTKWWSGSAHPYNWGNDDSYPFGCSIDLGQHRVKYNRYGWQRPTMNAQTAESKSRLRLTRRLDGTYYLSERVCETEETSGTSCDSRVDYTYGEMWYLKNQTRTELICGDHKTVYDSPVGCAEGNGGANCTKSPEWRWLRDQDTLCASILYDGVPHGGNYSLSKPVCEADSHTCVRVDDHHETTWWHHDAQTRTELICGDNKTVYDDPDGCMEFNHNQTCTESPELRWLRDDETSCDTRGGTYYLSERVCGGTLCDSEMDDTYGQMWYLKNQTRTELICGENKTVYDSAVGCAEGNGGANCTKSPEGRYLLNIDADCSTHYVSAEACSHVGKTCVGYNGMYMTEAQRVAHWQCVFTAKSTLETAAEKWCGPLGSPPTERHLIDSSYGNCTLDMSQWDVSAITSFEFLFNAQDVWWYARKLNKTCNPNVGDWDMSSATSIAQMFRGQDTNSFTRNLSSWNTAKVTDVRALFLWNKVPASGICRRTASSRVRQ